MAQGTGGEQGTPEDASAHELPVAHVLDEMTQDEVDAYWLAHVYRPDERQLTLRAVLAGMALGGVLAVANLYIGLKIGWSMGMAITSTILAFSLFKLAESVGMVKREFTMLENNTVASTASAAGYYTSAGMVSAIPALYITTQTTLVWWQLAFWMSAVSFIGVVMAVPMRRQMIDVDRLKFPSGTACAETIRSMHHNAGEALAKAWALFWGALVAAVAELPAQVAAFGKTANPAHWKDFGYFFIPGITVAGRALKAYAVALPTSLLLYASGAIMGLRVGLSMGIAAVVLYLVGGPWLAAHGVVNLADDPSTAYRSMLSWAVWPGVLGALAGSLLQFALKWRSIAQAFGSIGRLARANVTPSRMSAVEVPPAWFGWGLLASTAFVSAAAKIIFDIPIWMSVVATALSFVLAIVACRATGETDVTPIGPLGKITQLAFAGIRPGHYTTNLMTASITAGAAAHSGDLLTDLKTGYLLGGAPRRQFIAQFMGILAGALFCVPAYRLVVGDGEKIGSVSLPAPAAQTWAVVADLLAHGIHSADRGPAQVTGTSIETVTLSKRPPKLAIGDALRITEGPNAGQYEIVGFERKTLILDRDLPVAAPGDGDPFAAQVLAPDGSLRGGAGVTILRNTAARPAVRFVARPAGLTVNDYVHGQRGGEDVFHQIKGLRGDVAMIDHALMVPGEGAVTVSIEKKTLPPYAETATFIAILLGLGLTLLEVYGPKSWRAYLPSVTGMGIAFVIACHDSMAMAIGAILAWMLAKAAPRLEERYNVAASSGMIAGSSIMGLLLIILAEVIHWLTLG
jgi:uncharacterized oligopeptide transporter (OPT) family protein